MTHENKFRIVNNLAHPIIIVDEPEALEGKLGPGDGVQVWEGYENEPLTLTVSLSVDGELAISLWRGDGKLRLEKDGIDILRY